MVRNDKGNLSSDRHISDDDGNPLALVAEAVSLQSLEIFWKIDGCQADILLCIQSTFKCLILSESFCVFFLFLQIVFLDFLVYMIYTQILHAVGVSCWL